jgi:hypothetical protein
MAKPSPSNESLYESLVLAVATGSTIAAWCKRTGTGRTTASGWQREPKFAEDVAKIRKMLLDEAVGKFTKAVSDVADGMIKLAGSATSEATKLAAQKAVLEHLIQLTEFAELKNRVEEIERRLQEPQKGSKQWPSHSAG